MGYTDAGRDLRGWSSAAVPLDKKSLTFIPEPVLKSWRGGAADDPASSARVNTLAKLAENDWKLTARCIPQEFPCLLDRIRLTKASFPGLACIWNWLNWSRPDSRRWRRFIARRPAPQSSGPHEGFRYDRNRQFADLVLLDANPAEDIANTRRIFAVIRDGQFLDRQALDLMLAKAVTAARAVRSEK